MHNWKGVYLCILIGRGSLVQREREIRSSGMCSPWILLLLIVFQLVLAGCKGASLTMDTQEREQAAFDRLQELGADAVWEAELVVVSFSGKQISDDDLAVFRDFPLVQILSLTNTPITDAGLVHLEGLANLESLALDGTKVTAAGVDRLKQILPKADIQTAPFDKSMINPFTGKPFSEESP